MKQLTLRLPEDVHARLKAQAEREHRSMHAEILHLLSAALEATEQDQRPPRPS